MSFPKYPAYKESGIEWIGKVPVGWNIKSIKRVAQLHTEKSNNRIFPVALENIQSKTGKFVSSDTEFEGEGVSFQKGDILFGKLRPYLAKVWLADKAGEAVGDFHVINPISCNGDFLRWILISDEVISQIDGSTFGAKMPRASWDFISQLSVPLPPVSEQQAIASFLDRECEKIDALIAEQERLIALLAEKRQAVISHAVTKGLNPTAPMKDSGIPWIGMVPEGWEVVRFSRLVAISEGQVDPRNEQYASMILVAPNHIEAGTGHLREMITASDQNAESGKYLYKAGAVLYSKIRPSLAKVVIAPVSGLCSADMYPLTSRGSLSHLYLAWLMLSPGFTAWTVMESDRVAMPKINREKLNEAMLPLPPLSEQLEISEYIKNEIINFDTTMNITRTAIILLKERRAALISAAVTGKIDVRAQSKALAA